MLEMVVLSGKALCIREIICVMKIEILTAVVWYIHRALENGVYSMLCV